MHKIHYTAKYIRRNLGLWIFGAFTPAFFSMATNIYYAGRLEIYAAKILEKQSSLKDLAVILGITVVVLVILSSIDDVGRYLFELFATSTECEIRQDFYDGMMNTSLKNLNKFHQGEIIARYNTDTGQSACMVTYDVWGSIYPLIVGTGYLIAVMMTNYMLGILMLVLGAGVIILNSLYLKKMMIVQEEILKANEEFVMNCSNAVHGKMSIRQYSAREMVIRKIEESTRVIRGKSGKGVNLQTLKILTSDGLANICTYLMTPIACVLAVKGYISIPAVLFIHQICRCYIQYTQNMANAVISYNTHAVSTQRVCDILDLPKENEKQGDYPQEDFPGNVNIRFENVNVSYDDKQVLNHVSFEICEGEVIGLVGASGSGKSTLIKALLQMVDYDGKILIGGIDSKKISMEQLRANISYSPEHSDLFDGTVSDNIRFGDQNATDEAMGSVLGSLAVDEAAEFLSRDVGEKGDRLSGGQRQKVSITRAVMKHARVVVLDEPTASLDANSEMKVMDMILDMKKSGKLVLLISHKTSTLRVADRILQIKDGMISELEKNDINNLMEVQYEN